VEAVAVDDGAGDAVFVAPPVEVAAVEAEPHGVSFGVVGLS
jgi:hypothetical protein